MKLSFKPLTKEIQIEGDIENVITKSIDAHDNNWEKKYQIKNQTKKEMIELKHQYKKEKAIQKQNKRNFIQKIMDEKTRKKELELAEQRKKEEEAAALKAKIFKIKIITTIILSITSLILFVVGIILRINNIDGEILTLLGFFPLIAIAVMWFTTQK